MVSDPESLFQEGGVERIERALIARGYLPEGKSRPDDDLGEKTSAALRAFQQDRDLARTGAPDAATLRALGLDPAQIYRSSAPR